jgi:predicted secreted hydrolase
MNRRRFLASCVLTAIAGPARGDVTYPAVRPGTRLRFPRDHGAHADYRTEWWYVTAWVRDGRGRDRGLQITFFRNRPGLQEDNPSAFAPRQLLFAHAALADPDLGRLRHDQRAARQGFGLAAASERTTDVRIDDWSLVLDGDRYRARIRARDFDFDLDFAATQPILLQGEAGYSRKGPGPDQASYYYSRPQLAVSGTIAVAGRAEQVTGVAWLDHEWSSEIMGAAAVGWDWIGINLDDGGAFTAFRMRDKAGASWWAGGSHRPARGDVRKFANGDVSFAPTRTWRSPRTGATYPVAMRVTTPVATIDLEPLMDDQELDSRASVGTVYWEGAVRAYDGGRRVGRGYLELTGYWRPMAL